MAPKKQAKANVSISKQGNGGDGLQVDAKIDKLTRNFNDLAQSQNFISAKYDEMLSELKEYKKSAEQTNALRLELAAAIKKCSALSDEIQLLKEKQNTSEQANLNTNVLVRGISAGDDADAAVKKIAHIVDVPVDENDLISVQRQTYTNKEPAIIAKFKSMEKKRAFVRASKQKKLSSRMYGYKGENRPIYVDEQLTTQSFNLFKEAKKKLKRVGFKHVWIQNGDILVRETDNAKILNIRSLTQIIELEKEKTLRKNNANGIAVNSNADSGSNTTSRSDNTSIPYQPLSPTKTNTSTNEDRIENHETNNSATRNTSALGLDNVVERARRSVPGIFVRRMHNMSSSVIVNDSDLDSSELEFVDASNVY